MTKFLRYKDSEDWWEWPQLRSGKINIMFCKGVMTYRT